MRKIILSIILPVYNVEEYLEKSLDSILNQSYKEYEFIIVDDGSKDNSLGIIKRYSSKFKNFKFISQDNKGVSAARNIALENAEGEYILFVDSDDFLEKDMIEKIISTALNTKADIVISNYYLFYDENNYIKFIKDMPKFHLYESFEIIDMILNNKIQGQLWNKLFKSTLLKNNDFFFEEGRYIQDIFPVFKVVNKSNKIAYIDEGLYFYRQRETSTVHKKNKKLTEDYYHAMKSIITYIEENNINVNKYSLRIFKGYVFSYFIYHYTNEDLNNNYKAFKKSNYIDINVHLKEIIFLRRFNIKDKIRIFLWKLGIFNFLKKVKKSYGQ